MTFEAISQIGQGTYGIVYKAKVIGTSRYVALKQIKIKKKDGVPCTTLREIAILRHLKHPNVVSLESVFHNSSHITLVFEYCLCDLKKFMKQKRNEMSFAEVKSFSYQLLEALSFIHSNHVIHRDIKPQNVLISQNGSLKLCDFGLSCLVSVPHEKLSLDVVTQWYRAPEILLKDEDYGKPSDVWSVGCVIYEMITGGPLFPCNNDDDQLNSIFDVFGTPDICGWYTASLLPGYPTNCRKRKGNGISNLLPDANENIVDLLQKILNLNPKKRYTAKEAISHKLFDDIRGIDT